MVNEQVLQGKWNEVRGKLRERWSQLSDNELGEFKGNVEQLVGRIQRKTGAARETVEDYLTELTEEAADATGRVGRAVENMATQVNDSLADGYAEAEDFVRARPGQAIALAVGVGIVAGLGLAVLLRGRSKPTMWQQGRDATEHASRSLADAIVGALPESIAARLRG
jgi:uncharacterized protein YjbJ (UPF0337 family)